MDTFPLAQPIQYRREIETELKNPGVDSVLSLLRTLRADETKDETKVDSGQQRISDYKACLAVDAAEKVPIYDKILDKIFRKKQKEKKQKRIACINETRAVIGGKIPSCDGL